VCSSDLRKTPFCFSTEMFFENLPKLIQRMTLESPLYHLKLN